MRIGIGKSRDSGFDASHRPGMTTNSNTRYFTSQNTAQPSRKLPVARDDLVTDDESIVAMGHHAKTFAVSTSRML
jgi:hypothetical protein